MFARRRNRLACRNIAVYLRKYNTRKKFLAGIYMGYSVFGSCNPSYGQRMGAAARENDNMVCFSMDFYNRGRTEFFKVQSLDVLCCRRSRADHSNTYISSKNIKINDFQLTQMYNIMKIVLYI